MRHCTCSTRPCPHDNYFNKPAPAEETGQEGRGDVALLREWREAHAALDAVIDNRQGGLSSVEVSAADRLAKATEALLGRPATPPAAPTTRYAQPGPVDVNDALDDSRIDVQTRTVRVQRPVMHPPAAEGERSSRVSPCCKAPVEDAGMCRDGCCDRWRCTKCKHVWLEEGAD